MKNLQTSDPKEHTRNIKSGLQEMMDHIRNDIEKVNDPKAEALFETTVEVLSGLVTAFSHFEKKNEEAWK